ncbi:MAG TPA: transglutaminase domain-containing protein, partial [Polyangia bacterium]
HDNPYRRYDDGPVPPPPEPTRPAPPAPAARPAAPDAAPAPGPDGGAAPAVAAAPDAGPAPAPAADGAAPGTAAPDPPPSAAGSEPAWPLPAALHPLVAALPAEVERDPQSVGRYLREGAPDPYQRLKAVHDYVADRVSYDVEAYLSRRLPPQDAATVLRTRRGVCAGYAKLLEAIGRAAGLDVTYVVGDARSRTAGLSGEGHAWNAARIDGRWYLIDATWDAGGLDGSRFKKEYRTDYFMTPPEIFGIDHFPDRPAWQLRPAPLSRGEFLRQPALRPRFYALGLELIEPTRSQTDVRGALDVRLRNPRGLFFLATAGPLEAAGAGSRCEVTNGRDARIRCSFPAPGAHRVMLFGHTERYGTFALLGQLDVNNAR